VYLYGTNVTYIIFSITLISISASILVSSSPATILISDMEDASVSFIVINILLTINSMFGIYSTKIRWKEGLITWLLIFTLLNVVLIILANNISNIYYQSFDEFGKTVLLGRWESIVSISKNNKQYLLWIQSIQKDGKCCGWIDSTNMLENPNYLNCNIGNANNNYCLTCYKNNADKCYNNIKLISNKFIILVSYMYI